MYVLIFLLVLVWVTMDLQRLLELQIFMAPWVVASSIAVTRIHRGLVDYASAGSTEQYDTTPYHPSLHSHTSRRLSDLSHSKANGRAGRKANRVPITFADFTQVSRMEVAIPEMYMQDEALQRGQHGSEGSFIDVEGQLYENSVGQAKLNEIVENGVGFATESCTT
jgi:hypothetical protein